MKERGENVTGLLYEHLLLHHTHRHYLGEVLERAERRAGRRLELVKFRIRGLGRGYCVEHRPELIAEHAALCLKIERLVLLRKRTPAAYETYYGALRIEEERTLN